MLHPGATGFPFPLRRGGRTPLDVEALAATAAWVHRYDTGEWDDPPGKLALLFELERVAQLPP